MKGRHFTINLSSKFLILLSSAVCFWFPTAWADCDSVLIPSVVSIKSDYALLQSYAKVNSSELYDEIKKAEAKSAGGSANYGAYGADYKQSNSKEDFQLRVENRLSTEQFQMSVADARAYYRQGLEGNQVNAWGQCKQKESDGGYLLLSASHVNRESFLLRVDWNPPVNTGEARLRLNLTNGTIDGKSEYVERIKRGSRTYEVKSNSTGQTKAFANISGLTDAVMVSNEPKKVMPPLKIAVKEKNCAENDECKPSKVIACLTSSDKPSEVPPGVWLIHPNDKNFQNAESKTTAIIFGNWVNPQCGLQGNGWHARIGSCETGQGDKWQRCDQVKVEYETFE